MKIKLFYLLILFLPILLIGCEADVNLSEISNKIVKNESIIVPLGTINVNIGELINKYYSKDHKVYGDSSQIAFQYSDSTSFEFPKIDLIENIKPSSKEFLFNPSGLFIPPISANTNLPTISDVGTLDLGIKNDNYQRIDSVLVKKAVFSVTITQTDIDVPADNITATISFPNSNTLVVTPTAYGVENLIELKNFKLNTTNALLPLSILIHSKTGNNSVLLTSNSKLKFNFSIKELDFDVAYGYFPPTVLSSNTQKFQFSLEKYLPTGLIKLSNPKIDVSVKSNIGTYLIYKLEYLKSYINNDTTNAVFARFDGGTTNLFDLSIDKKPAKPGEWVTKDFKTFDKDNGEIYKLLEHINKPTTLEYKYALVIDTNIVKKDPSPGFITSNPDMLVKYRVTVPISLNPESYYDITDSVSNGFDDLSNVLNQISQPNIDSITLVLSVNNGLPVKSTLQMIFSDGTGKELQTDFQKEFTLNAGNVNADGVVKVGNETKQNIQVLLTRKELDILKTALTIRFKIRIEGKDLSSKIRFTTNDYIDIKAGVFLKCKVSTTL
jgi:hypothetical protein